jgi:uracil-DNA glycosylase family 4
VSLEAIAAENAQCRRCPRLVAWREEVARVKRASFAQDTYWGRPVPGFGDPQARILLFGLAPAAHGANRTGRVFTGDRSGDFMFASLHRTGFANQPTSVRANDGLKLIDMWIAAAVRCAPPANKPTPGERENCLGWSVREVRELPNLRLIVCLGSFAWDAALRLRAALDLAPPRPRPKFGHDVVALRDSPLPLLGCFHPSQQNTFTGKLTEPMMDAVFEHARELVSAGA